jgi:hypothetical protein
MCLGCSHAVDGLHCCDVGDVSSRTHDYSDGGSNVQRTTRPTSHYINKRGAATMYRPPSKSESHMLRSRLREVSGVHLQTRLVEALTVSSWKAMTYSGKHSRVLRTRHSFGWNLTFCRYCNTSSSQVASQPQ